MFDKTISGEVPEHRDFIYTKGIPALEKMGIKVTILRSEKNYVDPFTGRVPRVWEVLCPAGLQAAAH